MLNQSSLTYSPGSHTQSMSSVAAIAAVQLDRVLLGRSVKWEPIKELASWLLDEGSGGHNAGQGRTPSPQYVFIVQRAIVDSEFSQRALVTVDDLQREAERIGALLNRLTDSQLSLTEGDREATKQLRAFCVALAKRAAAEALPLDSMRPPSPFRRSL